jgi:hypothetical protein
MFNELANISYGIVTSLAVGVVVIGYMDNMDAIADRIVEWIETRLIKREHPLRVSWKAALAQMDAEFVANRADEMIE